MRIPDSNSIVAIFNESGNLKDIIQSSTINQGNNNINTLYIGYDNHSNTNYYATLGVQLPTANEQVLPELTTYYSEFFYDGKTYNGYSFNFGKELTAYDGVMKVSIFLKSYAENKVLAFGMLNISILKGILPSTPNIDEAQLEALNTTIAELHNDIEAVANDLEQETTSIRTDFANGLGLKLEKNFSTADYETFDWDTLDDNEYVPINKNVNGVVTAGKARLKDLYNKVNNIEAVEGNIAINAENIPYKETNVKEYLDNAVYISKIEETGTPIMLGTSERAICDKDGNEINLIYARKNKVLFNGELIDDITLNETLSNYRYLDITFKNTLTSIIKTIRIDISNQQFYITDNYITNSNERWINVFVSNNYEINDTLITLTTNSTLQQFLDTDDKTLTTDASNIKILRVEGVE